MIHHAVTVAGIGPHVVLALAGYAAFLLAGLSGLLYLHRERQLKGKRPAWLQRTGVPLETLDRANLWALWAGFGLFTLGVFHGLRLSPGRIGMTDPKTVWTLVTWTAYAVLLLVRTTAWSRGPKVAAMSVLCLLLVGFTFLGVNQFLGTRHVFF